MAGKEGGVAILALPCFTKGRPLACAASGIVTGETTITGMHLASPDERGNGGIMAAGTINSRRAGRDVDLHRSQVVMGVGGEIGGMALGTCAAGATINRGIAVAVGSDLPRPVGGVVTRGATGVDGGDNVPGMTSLTKHGPRHLGCMIMSMAVEVGGMTT